MPLQIYRRYFFLMIIAAFLTAALAPGAAQAASMLKMNDRGKQVLEVQKKLRALDYSITSVDGVFGQETKRAVLAFQRDKRIRITGMVDARTWKELNRAKPKSRAKPKKTAAAASAPPPIPVKTAETAPFVAHNDLSRIVKTAKSYIGAPYKFGGATPKGFDCSGYLQYVFSQYKYPLPRTADEQFKLGKKVASNSLQEGDLVFFSTYERGVSHCGIYLGGGKFIHTSSSKGVRVDELKDAYWQPRYRGAKRVIK